MKTEQEVLQQIINFIKVDSNVKVAVLNGSRANTNAPRDFMQDYDIAVFVENIEEAKQYKQNTTWISTFGQLVILQQNDFDTGAFIFLMQYDDGLRIDLSFHPFSILHKALHSDSLSKVLYDPNHLIKNLPVSNESSYFVQKPTQQKWDETLNELWWIQTYVAKGLWRDEIPLAKELYDIYLLNPLRELLSWHIAIEKNWQVNVGHGGKWLKRLLDEEMYHEYISFYASADKKEQWGKLLKIGAFIGKIGKPLAEKLAYEYPLEYDKNVSKYIRKIYQLPEGAKSLSNS